MTQDESVATISTNSKFTDYSVNHFNGDVLIGVTQSYSITYCHVKQVKVNLYSN